VFPTQKAFADGVIKEGIEPASNFPFGTYPTDTLKYHGDVTVEFQTPANTEGLGTELGLPPNDQPINGVAAIKWDGEDIYLVCLTVRLTPDTRDLTTQIIQQFERTRNSREGGQCRKSIQPGFVASSSGFTSVKSGLTKRVPTRLV
jgi:hypothetical protein